MAEPRRGAAPERRQLTIVFCDLVGSTALSSRLDPEDLRDVIGAYHRCVADTMEHFGGFIARYSGDGALVYFGYPHAHEDNAARAVRAGLALVSHLAKLEVHGERLNVRIGIATGLVVVGELVNAGAAREQTALGETPNLAARLQALADDDAIVIADTTRRVIGDRFRYRDLGAVELKGFARPVRAFQIVGEERARHRLAAIEPQPESRSAAPTALVGREQELGVLLDCWEGVVDGRGGAVLITGDAGIGKSRLAKTLMEQVEHERHYELEFHCAQYYANSPLYPVLDLIPGVLGWRRADTGEAKIAKLAAFCDRNRLSTSECLPLLIALLALPPSARFALAPMSPERQKQQTLRALLDLMLAFANERPLLMLVEDVHWIDPTTMELLALLIDQLPAARVLVLFTARLPFAPPWPPNPHVVALPLARFTPQQSEEMLQHVAAQARLPRDVVDQIVSRTDGVPLFIEELTKAVLESGAGTNGPSETSARPSFAIPTTLTDSLTARLDRLGTAKAVAQVSAVLGRHFSYAMLKAVCDLDDTALARELSRLVDAEFVYRRSDPPEASYVFKHALLQEAAYQSLLRSTRQHYHLRVAQELIERFPAEADAHPEIVAMHCAEGADLDAAVTWWQKAGQYAFRRASYAESVAHFTKGLRVLDALPESQSRDQSELGLQVELGYALIPLRGWAAPPTAQAFTRAGELCGRIGDASKLFRALWGLAAFQFVRGDQHRALPVADQCASIARRSDDVDALIEANYMRGIVRCAMGDFMAGRDFLEACIRLYGDEARDTHRVLYGQDAKASGLGWLALCLWTLGFPDEALERADEALRFVRGTDQPFLLARSLAAVGFVHVLRGDAQGSQSPLAQAIQLCLDQGFAYFHAILSSFEGANLVHLGRTEEGIVRMRASIARLHEVGAEVLFTIVLGQLASAHLALGEVSEGLAAVAEGLDCARRNGERWGEAELHRLRGQLLLARGFDAAEEAEACFERAIEIARGQGANAYWLRATTSRARLCHRQGRTAQAVALLSEALSVWPARTESADLHAARTLRRELAPND